MTTATLTDADLATISSNLESATASEIVAWAVDTFGDGLCLAASMADAVLIDVATRVHPSIEVVFLDTQYHFPETLATADRVKKRYKLELRVLTPDRDPDDLWRTDTDACCDARKVQPMAKHLATRTAWMSGLRRAESDSRRDAAIVSHDSRGLVKINPLATWSDARGRRVHRRERRAGQPAAVRRLSVDRMLALHAVVSKPEKTLAPVAGPARPRPNVG